MSGVMKLVLYVFVRSVPAGLLLLYIFIPQIRVFLLCAAGGIAWGYLWGRIAHWERYFIANVEPPSARGPDVATLESFRSNPDPQ
jgi:hypothetical protein